MAAAVVWSQEALDDIGAIADYINRDSPHHARRVVEQLYELGDAIAAHPQAGRIVPELGNPQVRERFVYSYRVLYEIGTLQIDILAAIHGRRLLESVEDRFD
jgi:plasmid stabilization system protein ParE